MKGLRERMVEGRLEELHMYIFDQRKQPGRAEGSVCGGIGWITGSNYRKLNNKKFRLNTKKEN